MICHECKWFNSKTYYCSNPNYRKKDCFEPKEIKKDSIDYWLKEEN